MRSLIIPFVAIAAVATADDAIRVAGTAWNIAARAVHYASRIERPSVGEAHGEGVRCRGHARGAAATAVPRILPAAVTADLPPVRDSLLHALREGGLVIVFRHATTDHSNGDDRDLSLTDRSTQRNLTAAGVEQAKQIGEALRALAVPVDSIYSSPLFRTMDTAINAFGRAEASEALWRNGTREQRVQLLSEPPRPGANRVLVTHNFVLMSLFDGMRPSDIREGDAVVVRPRGEGKYDVIGRLTPDELRRLAAPDLPGAAQA